MACAHISRLAAFGALFALVSAAPAPSRAADPVDLTASSWVGTGIAKAKLSARGVGGVRGEELLVFRLYLGPLAAPPLAPGRFLLVLDDGEDELEVQGGWAVDAKGKPLLAADAAALEAEFRELFLEVCEGSFDPALCSVFDLLDFQVQQSKLKLGARAQDGVEQIRVGGKLKIGLVDPASGTTLVKVSFGFKDNRDGLRQ